MRVRPARHDEKDILARIFLRARNHGMTYVPPVPPEHLGLIADEIFSRNEEVWLAEDGGRPVGFLAIRRSRRNGWEVLERLYVEPEAQNQGLGTALLEQAKRLRPDGLYLWVFQQNTAARRLYERHGFRVVTLRFGVAADNMEKEPDALYAWVPTLGRAPVASDRGSTAR
jgi:ribosomal protein S18 acetylase RimI-like enzyme